MIVPKFPYKISIYSYFLKIIELKMLVYKNIGWGLFKL